MASLPLSLEAAREKLTGEWMAEAGLVAATVVATAVLSHALLLGLGKYTIFAL
jgi:hypothetical protein